MKHSKATITWDPALIEKYDMAGPRYTSYPTALQFSESFTAEDTITALKKSNWSRRPLSLYFHIPFCNTLCYYCACNKIATKQHNRARVYLDHLIDEMEMIAEVVDQQREVIQIHWGGGTPTFLDQSEMTELMFHTGRLFNVTERASKEYSIEIDPRDVSHDDLALISGLGFRRISLGIQDFNPRVQKAVNRVQPFEMVQSVIQSARNFQIGSINVDLIYGLPFQTLHSFDDTLDQVIQLSPDRISLFNYAHLPHRFAAQKRIRGEDLPDQVCKLQILEHSIEKLTQAGYVYIGMDHFAKPEDELAKALDQGELQRNFQGYSTLKGTDLLAFGTSAISSVENVYSQNTTDIHQYQERIARKELPVAKGYRLSPDDRIRRDVIMQIICNGELRFQDVEQAFGLTFEAYFKQELPQLHSLAKDGLIEMDENGLAVTASGRLLVRRVCLVFDRYFQPSPEPRYSRII